MWKWYWQQCILVSFHLICLCPVSYVTEWCRITPTMLSYFLVTGTQLNWTKENQINKKVPSGQKEKNRPTEAPPYIWPQKKSKFALKCAIIWSTNPLLRTNFGGLKSDICVQRYGHFEGSKSIIFQPDIWGCFRQRKWMGANEGGVSICPWLRASYCKHNIKIPMLIDSKNEWNNCPAKG